MTLWFIFLWRSIDFLLFSLPLIPGSVSSVALYRRAIIQGLITRPSRLISFLVTVFSSLSLMTWGSSHAQLPRTAGPCWCQRGWPPCRSSGPFDRKKERHGTVLAGNIVQHEGWILRRTRVWLKQPLCYQSLLGPFLCAVCVILPCWYDDVTWFITMSSNIQSKNKNIKWCTLIF